MAVPHVFAEPADCDDTRVVVRDDVAHHPVRELDVDKIVPTHTVRSQIRWDGSRAERAGQRCRAVARAAAEQRGRARLPVIVPVTTCEAAFTGVRGGVACWEEATVSLRDAALHAPAGRITVGVGPEGGLTGAEVDGAGLPAVGVGTDHPARRHGRRRRPRARAAPVGAAGVRRPRW